MDTAVGVESASRVTPAVAPAQTLEALPLAGSSPTVVPTRRRGRRMRWTLEVAMGTAVALDFFTVTGIGIASWWLLTIDAPVSGAGHVVAATFCAGLIVLMLDYLGFYSHDRLLDGHRLMVPIVAACIVSFGVLVMTSWAASGRVGYDHFWLGGFFLVTLSTLIAGHFAFSRFLAHHGSQGRMTRNVIVIGAGESGIALLNQIAAQRNPWTRVLGLFDDRARDTKGRVPRRINGVKVLGTVDQALTFARRARVDDIIVALPLDAHERIRQILHVAQRLSADVHLAPGALLSLAHDRRGAIRSGLPVLRMSAKPVAGWHYVLKRAMDLLVAGTALILLAPVMALIACAIKFESRGPVLFRQPRFGINNRTIHVLKFRSMYHDKQDLHASTLVTRGDPRVTPLGGFLRRTSLDELPQLVNVLRGEMSVVGPRPHAKNARAAGRMYQEVVEAYAHRHRIKPGITGWAQVNGWRGETDTEEKIVRRCEHDLYYIEHWSIWLDLYIVFATLGAPFHRAAY
jgi:Undecaprenyl-phosphate glucose phosphotransferase